MALDAPCESRRGNAKQPGHPLSNAYLIISDLQVPFQLAGALSFCRNVARDFRIPRENVLCVGDETDQYFASHYDHTPDAGHSPVTEIEASIDELKRWYSAWPEMRVCNSNHGARWGKKAAKSGIPSRLIRPYREVIEAPPGWRWADEWVVKTKIPFLVEHGHCGAQGSQAARKAIDNGLNTAQGHDHARAGTTFFTMRRQKLWHLNCGTLMDPDSYAAAYGKEMRTKPVLSVGVVLDDGRTPVVVPYAA